MRAETAASITDRQGSFTNVAVVIVGAGPTGLAAGNLLGMAGIDTLILERNVDLSDCPKAISIDDEGLRICQALGLSNEVIRHVLLDIDARYVSRGQLLAKVSPSIKRNGYPLISTLHQPTFEATLLHGLERFPCVEVLFQHNVESFEQHGERVRLSARTPDGSLLRIECVYLLACDGGRSPIRHALDIPMLPAGFHLPTLGKYAAWKHHREQIQRWLVVDCVNDDTPSSVATFFCDYGRQAVTVPAPQRGRRWEFMLLPGELAEEMLRVEKIHALIQETCRSFPHGIFSKATPQIIRQTVYTFRNAIAERFARGHIFLLGDAAHLMPPFGGQGMNSGLRDVHNLCWKLHMVLSGRADRRLLETYHEERYPHVAQMIHFSSLLGNLIMPATRPLALLRDLFFHGMNAIPSVRRALGEVRVKPQPKYMKGFLLFEQSRHSKALKGVMLPQPHVMTQEGERVLLDDVLGNGFVLLRLCENRADAFAPIQGQVWERLGVHFVGVQPAGASFTLQAGTQRVKHNLHTFVVDIEHQLTAFLRHNRSLYVLVRPDRYIMGVFRVAQAKAFTAKLQGMLHVP